jgi:predicted nucleotidyltransferase
MKNTVVSNLETLRKSLREYMPEMQERHGVKTLGIFGSYVHGRQNKRSDVDLLVEFDEHVPLTLVSFIALERELGNLLGQKVDLVERETLKPVIGQRVLAEVIPV